MNLARSAADQRSRRSRNCSIAISAAGVTISVSTVAKPSPKTIADQRLARAEKLKAQFVDGKDDFAKLRQTIAERWLRAQRASFVYSVAM